MVDLHAKNVIILYKLLRLLETLSLTLQYQMCCVHLRLMQRTHGFGN